MSPRCPFLICVVFQEASLELELFSLQQTRETLTKLLELVRCVKADLHTVTTNHIQLKNTNENLISLIEKIDVVDD